MFIAGVYFIVYAAQFLSYSLWQKRPPPEAIPVGSTFNIQNSIPHKSQKTKVALETNRAKEFQRGTAGVLESAKEGARGLSEGSDIGLGALLVPSTAGEAEAWKALRHGRLRDFAGWRNQAKKRP